MLKLRSTNRRVLLQRPCCQAVLLLVFRTALLAQAVQHVTFTPDGRFVMDGAATFPIGFTSGPVLGSFSAKRNDALAELKKQGYVFQLWYCPPRQWGPERESYLDALLLISVAGRDRGVRSAHHDDSIVGSPARRAASEAARRNFAQNRRRGEC